MTDCIDDFDLLRELALATADTSNDADFDEFLNSLDETEITQLQWESLTLAALLNPLVYLIPPANVGLTCYIKAYDNGPSVSLTDAVVSMTTEEEDAALQACEDLRNAITNKRKGLL